MDWGTAAVRLEADSISAMSLGPIEREELL